MTIGAIATIIMAVLRCMGEIDWSWLVIFLPMIIECGIYVLIGLLILIGIVSLGNR